MLVLNGAAAVLAACENHPVARFWTATLSDPCGFGSPTGTLAMGSHARRDLGFFVGEPDQLAGLLDSARTAGRLDRLGPLFVPRTSMAPDGFAIVDDWDLLWTTRVPERQPGQDVVAPLPADQSADAEINALLDLAMPDSTVRPGHASGPRWYGIQVDGVLVACAADRSGRHPTPAPVGAIGGVAVHPAHRGRGYGAAITAAVTTTLFDEYDLVTLAVWTDNAPAIRIYERLGYTNRYEVTSAIRSH